MKSDLSQKDLNTVERVLAEIATIARSLGDTAGMITLITIPDSTGINLAGASNLPAETQIYILEKRLEILRKGYEDLEDVTLLRKDPDFDPKDYLS